MNSPTLIGSHLDDLEKDKTLLIEINFGARADALEVLEFHVMERIKMPGTELTCPQDTLLLFASRAQKLKNSWQEIDRRLFHRLQALIRSGEVRGHEFKKMALQYWRPGDDDEERKGYDSLDLFLNGLTGIGSVPEPELDAKPGMVFYQKIPGRVVFEMAEHAPFSGNDVFVDVGSGLGQAVILMHLLTGTAARGIEYEPAYCRYSRDCASGLALAAVKFANENAVDADYAEGNVFFLYTPVEGKMLDEVLTRLGEEAAVRPIRIFTYGPCSIHVAGAVWLKLMTGDAGDAFSLCCFESIRRPRGGTGLQTNGNED